MSQPIDYDPSTQFYAFELAQPQFPGQELDVEFVNLRTTLDEIRANLEMIQRDDGALANGIVGYDALDPALLAGGIYPLTVWATATLFRQYQVVVQAGALYQALENHTAGVFATDLAAEKWDLLVTIPGIEGPTGPTGPAGPTGPTGDVATTRTLTAGAGLSGGGDLSADRSFSLDASHVRNAAHPASSTDNAAARFDSTAGALQNSALLIDDTGHISAFGGNIKFPGTQVASSDVNTLDDYEEGTWTPTITFATPGNLSVTYAAQRGWYRKVGDMVTIGFAVQTSAFTHTTASGNLRIGGLPFASNTIDAYGPCYFQGITMANYTQFSPQGQSAQTYLIVAASGSGQSASTVTHTQVPSGGTVTIASTTTYLATS